MNFQVRVWQCGFDSSIRYGILPHIRRMEANNIKQLSRNKLKISYASILTIIVV